MRMEIEREKSDELTFLGARNSKNRTPVYSLKQIINIDDSDQYIS